MSDVGGGGEPAAGGIFGRMAGFVGGRMAGARIPGVSDSAGDIRDLSASLKELKETLRSFSGGSAFMASGLMGTLRDITQQSQAAAAAMQSVTGQVRGPQPTGPVSPSTTTGGSNWATTAVASAGAAIMSAGGGGGGAVPTGATSPPGGLDITGAMGIGQSGKGFFQDILMMPLRYMRDTITANRQTALDASQAMSMNAFATGTSSQHIMQQLARFPGSILGQPNELLGMFEGAPQLGAMYGWGQGPNAPRTAGMLAGIRQMQMMTPGAPVQQMMGTLGGFAANTGAQQQAQMVTGGAFGMIKPGGGGQKTLSEWAESILRWFENMRGGGDRGKPFDHGQLMAQYFPGSNIDAWFDANGVPQGMRDYWWTYALGKTKSIGSTQGSFTITPEQANVGWQRLNATSALTRNEFSLAGVMSGAYANKEVSNRWLNDLVGNFQMQTIPAAVSKGVLNFMQYMPDTIEQMLMAALERSGMFGKLMAGMVGYGGLFSLLR